ncbi:MAG: plasmid stabilization protein [Gammaproteobacteria bacterium]|nr:MAG: plasmid stabilization protein [Gammaproteobacteria bacterium]
MSFNLLYAESYLKRAKRFAKQHPELKEQYRKTLMLLEKNPHHPSLRLHSLQGKLSGLHSISINVSYRLTIELMISDNAITLVNVGTHQDVYR